jgi:hypothetical protein
MPKLHACQLCCRELPRGPHCGALPLAPWHQQDAVALLPRCPADRRLPEARGWLPGRLPEARQAVNGLGASPGKGSRRACLLVQLQRAALPQLFTVPSVTRLKSKLLRAVAPSDEQGSEH